MLKTVHLNNADTCLTYILKRLSVYEKYTNLNGVDFIKLFHQHDLHCLTILEIGDIIVLEKVKPKFKYINTIIDSNGRVFLNKINNSYHFMVYEGTFITDYGFFGIRKHKSEDFDFKLNNYKYTFIKYKDL